MTISFDVWARRRASPLAVPLAVWGGAAPTLAGLGLARERHQAHQRILGHSCVHDEANALPAAADRSASDEVLDLVDQALHAGVFERGRARLVVLHRVLGFPTVEVAQQRMTCPIRQRRSHAETAIAHHTTRRSPDDGCPIRRMPAPQRR